MNKKINTPYERVMSRVFNRSRSSGMSSSNVTRHETSSSVNVGAKPSASNISSGVFSDLPTVLNDYVPESTAIKVKHSKVVKPRRTIKSLDPGSFRPQTVIKTNSRKRTEKPQNIAVKSAPSLMSRFHEIKPSSDVHLRECYCSDSKLKELKDEIKAYRNTEKILKLKSKLYKQCGVVLDDFGQVAVDKSVQAEVMEPDKEPENPRSEHNTREDARASVPDQQMKPASPRYPVDRYLVESSKKFEFVNILDDDIWHAEPAIRPEDEIILQKLHEMLQSTADDLKALYGELSKFHNPGIQIKTQRMPLDEEFNEKVHIEEVVNAKFHGHKIVENVPTFPQPKLINTDKIPTVAKNLPKTKVNTGVQVSVPIKKPLKNRHLGTTRTRIVQIDSDNEQSTKSETLNNGKCIKNKPAVSYNEYFFKYEEPKNMAEQCKKLQVQDMPSINIRNELREQKVLQLDIFPSKSDVIDNTENKFNVAVVAIKHDTSKFKRSSSKETTFKLKEVEQNRRLSSDTKSRKVTKMSVCDSSGSTNHSSDAQQNLKAINKIKTVLGHSSKTSARSKAKSVNTNKKETPKRSQTNLEEWRRKLNVVYTQPSTSKITKMTSKSNNTNKVSEKFIGEQQKTNNKYKETLNNAEYIPYAQLTLGGVRVSDIEKEICDLPDKNNVSLSPILDKILTSRENSFSKVNSSKRGRDKESPKILTTSDENLLQEVLDIEKNVSETLSKNEKKIKAKSKNPNEKSETDENNTYDDDFEDEKTDPPADEENISKDPSLNNDSNKSDKEENNSNVSSSENDNIEPNTNHLPIQNKTYTLPNLTLKTSVDVFEFIHSVDTQDTATQSNTVHKISLKETQTSPTNDKPRPLQPIHNDLWPPMDPKREIEKLLKDEKDLIKKIIMEEYGDLLQRNISKPSTSKEIKTEERDKNIYSYQKNTQTSPIKRSRTTSPFLSLTVDHHTSPMVIVTDEKAINVSIEDEEDGISINLSSPRFSLRLPHSSREVLSNLESHGGQRSDKIDKGNTQRTNVKVNKETNTNFRNSIRDSSPSSGDGDKSSSEISSLGEVKLKLKRKNKNSRVALISESSSSSGSKISSIGGIIPFRSEGEISLEQSNSRKLKSEGEVSFGQL